MNMSMMASKLRQVRSKACQTSKLLQSKACQTSKLLSKQATESYTGMMAKNQQYIQEPATVDKCRELSKQLFYTRLASKLLLRSEKAHLDATSCSVLRIFVTSNVVLSGMSEFVLVADMNMSMMASKLRQVRSKACQTSKLLQSKACQTSKLLSKQATESYTGMMAKNQQYIQEPATVDKCRELSKQLFYTRLARELDFVKHSFKNFRTEMPIERVGVAALFGLECFLWFWAVEIACRGFTVTGNDV
ncbi:putative ATPase, F0 complex, subunit G [Tanacetum coccineum]